MTTIVANRGCMVGDRKVTDGDMNYYTKKIKRIGGSLVGVAGEASACNKFLKWIKTADETKVPKFTKEESLDALVLNSEGKLVVYDKECQADVIENEYYAVGTGRQAAMAAMLLGACPMRALEVACEIDNGTGGKLDTLWLNEKEQS